MGTPSSRFGQLSVPTNLPDFCNIGIDKWRSEGHGVSDMVHAVGRAVGLPKWPNCFWRISASVLT